MNLKARKYQLLAALLLVMTAVNVVGVIASRDNESQVVKSASGLSEKTGLKTKELTTPTQEELKTDDLKVDNKSDSTKESETGVPAQKGEKNGDSPGTISAPAPAPAPAPVTVANVSFRSALLNFDPDCGAACEYEVGCRHSWAVTLSNGQVINHSNTYYYRDYPIGENFIGIVYGEPGYGRFPGEFANGLYLSILYFVSGEGLSYRAFYSC